MEEKKMLKMLESQEGVNKIGDCKIVGVVYLVLTKKGREDTYTVKSAFRDKTLEEQSQREKIIEILISGIKELNIRLKKCANNVKTEEQQRM